MKLFQRYVLVALIGSLLVAWHPLANTLKLAVENEEYTNILLILPVSLTLICAEWKSSGPIGTPSFRFGSLVLCLAGVFAVLSRWEAPRMTDELRLSVNMLALVTWWIGSFVFFFGTSSSRSVLFPLCFLYWMVPLPSFVLNEIIKYLQQGSALAAQLLFAALGLPVARDGLRLSIPGLTVEVAKECSSIRSSLLLLVTTMVLAQLFLRARSRKALVIALAVPLSVAKNGLRIFTIAMLGTRVDPGFLTGKFHHQGGIVFFTISLLVIFLLLWILKHQEEQAMERLA
jgi:exosortase